MRVNLSATVTAGEQHRQDQMPVVLNIRPICGLSGESEYRTTSVELLRMLNKRTDINSAMLDRFQGELQRKQKAALRNVNLSEETLTFLGFFID